MMLKATNLSGLAGIAHGFFGRKGGVSQGPFTSLNVSLRNADDPEHAWTNRARIAETFGAGADDLVVLRQVHGIDIIEPQADFDPRNPLEGDGLVATGPGRVLGVTSADCAPILMADPKAGIVGAAHAGWRGALDGISDRLIQAMERRGAKSADIIAAIGPCISKHSYEVGPEFEETFLAADASNAMFFHRPTQHGKSHFDLEAYLVARIQKAGIGHVEGLGVDTASDPETYFSYRRSCLEKAPGFGLQLSAIAILP